MILSYGVGNVAISFDMEQFYSFRVTPITIYIKNRVNCQSYNSTLRLIHTALKYLFQLCEDLICRHTGCQQLLQHALCFGFLRRFRCLGFSFDLFGLDSGDFLVD